MTGSSGSTGFSLPVGTVTFLLTDVEASMRAWETAPEAMAVAVPRHYVLLDEAITAHHGVRPVEQGEGDSVVGAFSRASDAVAAALAAQRSLAAEEWPTGAALRVRMAIHTGEAELRDEGNYFGPAMNRCARLRAIAHGGQILVSGPAADLVADRLPPGAALIDLGLHRLKDLSRPERVWGVRHPDLPPGLGELRSLDAMPNNLPVQLTSFVGRRAELSQLGSLLEATRLLTLTGAGGCGKTRLALQLAADVIDRYPGGAWLAELAALVDPERVAPAVATGLGEQDLSGDNFEVLVARIGDMPILAVLDNCEHLLGPVAALADKLLRRCENLTILATSREPLGVPDESAWVVPSLALPSGSEPAPPETLSQYEAVRLFLDRAVRARANFRLTEANGPAVAQICHRLDGIPLAIELAAARVRSVTVERVAAGLDNRFRLLTGGARTVLPRQQTLQASVEWGYELLTDAERSVFRQLSVFLADFSLDAAEAVVRGDDVEEVDVLDLLSALVDKSMVVAEQDSGRYRLLETLRQYGAARLVEAGETSATRDRLVEWACSLYDPTHPDYTVALTVGLVDAESHGVRAAFEWALASRQSNAVYRLAPLVISWELSRGDAREAVVVGDRAFAVEGADRSLRVGVLPNMVVALVEAGETDRSGALRQTMLTEARELGDPYLLGRSLTTAAYSLSDGSAEAVALYREAIDVLAAAGNTRYLGWPLSALAADRAREGQWQEAEQLIARVPADSDAVSGSSIAGARTLAYLCTGQFERARSSVESQASWGVTVRFGAARTTLAVQLDLAQGIDTGAAQRLDALLGEARERGHLTTYRITGWAPGAWALAHGDIERALASLSAWREAASADRVGSMGNSLYLVRALLAIERTEQARAELTRSVQGRQPSPYVAAKMHHLEALAARLNGDHATADQLHHDTLDAQHAAGWRPDLVHTLEGLAGIAAESASWIDAARLFGSAQALRDDMGYRLRWPLEQRQYQADIAAARAAIGQEAFESAYAEGQALDEHATIEYTNRARGERRRPTSGWQSLTPTEAEVARLAVTGRTNNEIAEQLLMGTETVKTHLSRVYNKIGVRSRTQLAAAVARRPTTQEQ